MKRSHFQTLLYLLLLICYISDSQSSNVTPDLRLFNKCTFHLVGKFKSNNETFIRYAETYATVIDNLNETNFGRYSIPEILPTKLKSTSIIANYRPKFVTCVVQLLFVDLKAPSTSFQSQINWTNSFLDRLVIH